VDALVARTDELARRWAIALILALPLDRLGELPLESFAAEAPSLCAQVVRALSSDERLERIGNSSSRDPAAPAPPLRLADVTGARDSTAVVEAMEALRGVLWDALVDEVGCAGVERSAAREMADLADRLAYVCSSVVASSLAQPPPARRHLARQRANGAAARAPREAEIPPLRAGESPARRSLLADGVAIVDEAPPPLRRSWPAVTPAPPRAREQFAAASGQPPSSREQFGSSSAPRRRQVRARALPWDPPLRPGPVRPADEAG
jgi:hypothetical protein